MESEQHLRIVPHRSVPHWRFSPFSWRKTVISYLPFLAIESRRKIIHQKNHPLWPLSYGHFSRLESKLCCITGLRVCPISSQNEQKLRWISRITLFRFPSGNPPMQTSFRLHFSQPLTQGGKKFLCSTILPSYGLFSTKTSNSNLRTSQPMSNVRSQDSSVWGGAREPQGETSW